MAGKKVSFEKAADEIQRQILLAWDKKGASLTTKSREVAEEVVEELKRTSPKKTGAYAAGWTCTEENVSNGYGGVIKTFTVHNATRYQLTHLLNNGHPSRNGSWVNGNQHITKVHRTIAKRLLEAAKEVLNEA